MKRLGQLVALVLVGILVAICTYRVESGSMAVVFRFGAVREAVGPGLHFRLPWPVETVTLVAVSEVRRAEIGELRLLTGDTNLINLDLVAQYSVADPVAWLIGSIDPSVVVQNAVKAACTDVVATMEVDSLLTTGRAELQLKLLQHTQAMLDGSGAGVRLVAVDVRGLAPPAPVVDAFNDVSSARGDRETLALSAEAYAAELLPRIRGDAAQTLEKAHGTASALLAQTAGDIDHFRSVKGAWQESPAATRQRYQSMMLEAVADRARVHVVPAGTQLDLSGGPP